MSTLTRHPAEPVGRLCEAQLTLYAARGTALHLVRGETEI